MNKNPQVFSTDFEKLENQPLGKLGWTCAPHGNATASIPCTDSNHFIIYQFMLVLSFSCLIYLSGHVAISFLTILTMTQCVLSNPGHLLNVSNAGKQQTNLN